MQSDKKPPNKPGGTTLITEDEWSNIRQKVLNEVQDLFILDKPTLPPLRIVNHEIPLINPNLRTTHRASKCPDHLRDKLKEKVDRYITAGWWERSNLPSSAPLMIVLKKDGNIQTVIDARQRNENTLVDVTPMPDQETIRNDVVRAPFHLKIDLSDVYEQIHISPKQVNRTAFATPFRNMVSHVMQQGDKNGPSTFQRLMNQTFADMISVFLHAYQDHIFIYSQMLEDHLSHLQKAFERLQKVQLYLS